MMANDTKRKLRISVDEYKSLQPDLPEDLIAGKKFREARLGE